MEECMENKRNNITRMTIKDIEVLFDEYGLTYSSAKGDYRIMGKREGSSLNLNMSNFIIYTRDDDFKNIVNAKLEFEDLVLKENGNNRDGVRPNVVRCETLKTLKALLQTYSINVENKK